MNEIYNPEGEEITSMTDSKMKELTAEKKQKRKRLKKLTRKIKKLKKKTYGYIDVMTRKDRNKLKKYKRKQKELKNRLSVIESQLADHETRLSRAEDGISRIIPVVERIQGYQRQEILQKITASNDIREVAKLLENMERGVFNVKSL